jgi:hypothetical protein
MVIMFFWLSLTLAIEGYAFGLTVSRLTQWISPFFKRTGVLGLFRIGAVLVMTALLVLGPLQAAQKLWRIQPEYRQFAIDWDTRDQAARQAASDGIHNAVMPAVSELYGLSHESSEHFALYYGLLGTVTFDMPKP